MQPSSSQSSHAGHGYQPELSRLQGAGSSAQRDTCSHGDAVHMLRSSLARQGAHGAVEFALQIRVAASPEDTITFGDLARVVQRFCGLGEAHVHAIFRMMDRDCHGRVAIPPFLDAIFADLSSTQMDLVNETYSVRNGFPTIKQSLDNGFPSTDHRRCEKAIIPSVEVFRQSTNT